MALILKDRISETTTTSGTGTITLAGARVGFQGFSAIGDGNTTYYCITDGAAWEVGLGTYTSTGNTLARTTVYSNSNGNTSPITLSAGTKNVFSPMPADGIITVNGSTIQVPGSAILPVANGGTGSNTATFSGANITSLNASSISSGTLGVANGGTGAATLDANNVILGNGTSAVQFVAPGTNGNVLTSNGTTWTSAAAGGGGGSFVYLASATPSASIVDFTGLDTSTYFSFLIQFWDVRANGLAVRMYPNGTLLSTASYNYSFTTFLSSSGNSGGTTISTAQTAILMYPSTAIPGANFGWTGYMYFFPAGGYSTIMGQWNLITTTTDVFPAVFSGFVNNANAANGIRIGTSAMGNITAGNFRLYGIKAS